MIRSATLHTLRFTVPGRLATKANFRKSGNWRRQWSRVKAFEESVGFAAVASGAGFALKNYGENPLRLEVVLFNQRRNLDLDNAMKSLADGLENVAFTNDRQVDSMEVARVYDEEGPRVRVTIKYLEAS